MNLTWAVRVPVTSGFPSREENTAVHLGGGGPLLSLAHHQGLARLRSVLRSAEFPVPKPPTLFSTALLAQHIDPLAWPSEGP